MLFCCGHEQKQRSLPPAETMRIKTAPRIFILTLICAATCFARSQPLYDHWVATWACSQQIPEPHNALNPDDLRDATLRQIVHLSVGGKILRVHISNAFGTTPLHFIAVHIAHPLSSAEAKIDVASDKALTFSGKPDVVVPAGAEFISDPLNYPIAALSNLAITLRLEAAPEQQTGHPGSRTTSYLQHGDMVSAADLPDAKKVDHWYWIGSVDVKAEKDAAAIVALGDSITDGRGSTTNGNDRWTDILAQKLQVNSKTKNLSVLNHGIGGNHLLTDGLGPNALARVDRDILAQTGVRYLIIFEGVNDLGKLAREGERPKAEHDALVQQMIAAYEQIILRAHAHGIKVFGATISPYVGSDYYHPTPANEADRTAVNDWIRQPGHFDAVIDFDKLTSDPARPDRLLPAYDSGDHLHPGVAGYKAMGESIPISLFR
jgi:lysophospholipase L1-like esterase